MGDTHEQVAEQREDQLVNSHLSSHHRLTIEKIFKAPRAAMSMAQVLSLLEDLGSVNTNTTASSL